MSAIEYQLLGRILECGSLRDVLKAGLDDEHFLDAESRRMFSYLREHWYNQQTNGTLPPLDRVLRRWPSFRTDYLYESTKDTKALANELKLKYLEANVYSAMELAQEQMEIDPREALSRLKETIDKLSAKDRGTGFVGVNDLKSMAETHYNGAINGTIFGIPWPWQCLTSDTLGKRPGDFIVFYGRMKSLKTWILLYCAVYDFVVNRKRVLIWSREMSRDKLGLRVASLLAQVDYQLFKKGLLPPNMKERAFSSLTHIANTTTEGVVEDSRYADIRLLAGADAPRALEGLDSQVDDFDPDVIYLDSFYHLDSPSSRGISVRWQRVANLAEDTKQYAEEKRLPVVAVHQANRDGEKAYGNTLTDMADADVIAREADLTIRIMKNPIVKELEEHDYEGEFRKMLREHRVFQKSIKNDGRPVIKLAPTDHRVLQAVHMERLREQAKLPRIGGEIACIPNGNREGVLEAFIINAIPAYNFDLITDKPDMGDVKEWVKQDDKADARPKVSNAQTRLRDDIEEYDLGNLS